MLFYFYGQVQVRKKNIISLNYRECKTVHSGSFQVPRRLKAARESCTVHVQTKYGKTGQYTYWLNTAKLKLVY